jgi:hypothetical protein
VSAAAFARARSREVTRASGSIVLRPRFWAGWRTLLQLDERADLIERRFQAVLDLSLPRGARFDHVPAEPGTDQRECLWPEGMIEQQLISFEELSGERAELCIARPESAPLEARVQQPANRSSKFYQTIWCVLHGMIS